ncbi:PHP domain-containing protein [Candidatus Aerophobetes bacterium]|nr:PHP domain-containing protein [Candidatus Aerophobetes bacterium]
MGKVDLHIHTIFSDGTLAPREAVFLAKELGLKAISITDHDSVEGLEEGLESAKQIGVELVPGVEMSSDVEEDEYHILGYYLHWRQKRFLSRLRFFQKTRKERNDKLLQRLKELGMEIKFGDLTKLAPKGVISRLHIARSMVEKKYVTSIDEAFEQWLNPGKPAYIKRDRVSPFEVINLIIDAEGIPVFAHPVLSKRDELIPRMVDAGLMGIEVYHTTHNEAVVKHYREIARQFDLLITGGSDCHGEAKGKLLMGKVHVPISCLWDLKRARSKVAQRVRKS